MNDVTGMPETAVVVGGSSDLARALLERLARRRLRAVILAGRDLAALDAAASSLRTAGVRSVMVERLDVREIAGHEAFADRCVAQLPSIDLLLVAAGTLPDEGVETLRAEDVAAAVETNFAGPAALTAAFARRMVAQGSGRIVLYSSVAGVRVRRANFLYGSTKAGLDGFGQGLEDALRLRGVSLTLVRPGFVRTKMTAGRPAQPLATTPDAVAAAVVSGLERGASVVYAPAALRPIFALARLVPRRIWQRLPS